MSAQVIKLTKSSVYDDIMEFVNLAHHSNNTKIAYEKAIRDFFRVIKGKEIGHLVVTDLEIKKKDVERFRSILQEEGLSNATINNRVAGVRKLYYELVANEYDLKVEFFKSIKKLDEKTNSYGFFTEEEVSELAKMASKEKFKGEIKSFFLLFCAETGIRKNASLDVKWSDFEVVNTKEVRINAMDKGNTDYRAVIAYDFYIDLLKIRGDSDKVFNLTVPTIDKMMVRLVDKLGVDPSRNLTFHSLRKTGVDYKFNANGRDIRVAQKAANHSPKSLNVTVGTYLTKDDYGVKGMISRQYEQEENIVDNLNLEQLKKLLESLDENTKHIINIKANELFGK